MKLSKTCRAAVRTLLVCECRSVMHPHGSTGHSMPRLNPLAHRSEDAPGSAGQDSSASMLGGNPGGQVHSARGRANSATGYAFGSLASAAVQPGRRQSVSTGALGLRWGASTPLPEDSTLRLQLPPRTRALDGSSAPSRGCTSADESNCTSTTSRPSGSRVSVPAAGEAGGGGDEAACSPKDGSTGEGQLVDLLVNSHAIPGLRREASLTWRPPEESVP